MNDDPNKPTFTADDRELLDALRRRHCLYRGEDGRLCGRPLVHPLYRCVPDHCIECVDLAREKAAEEVSKRTAERTGLAARLKELRREIEETEAKLAVPEPTRDDFLPSSMRSPSTRRGDKTNDR